MPVDPQSVTLPITDIVVGANIKNIRTVFDEAAIKELAQSIYAEGLLVPLLITESEDAAGAEIFELVAGARRLRAIQYLLTEIDPDWSCSGEAEEVRCSVYAGSIEDAAVLTGVENIEREEVDDVDIGDWLHSMIEENGWTQADLGKKMKKSSGWISSHVTFAERASDELKKALREKVLRFSTACELAKTLSHEDQDKRVSRARASEEKLTLEAAKIEKDKDRVVGPSKKKRGTMRDYAEERIADPRKQHAHGVSMALRWIDGLCTNAELEEVINWQTPADVSPVEEA